MTSTVSALIEGNYVDSYLYGGLLLAWDERGRLLIASTESLARAVADAAAAPRDITRALFVDNKLLRNPDVMRCAQTCGLSQVQNGDGATTHVSLNDLEPRFFDVAPNAEVLDLMATYGRLFISTDEALLTVPFNAAEVGELRHLLFYRCLSTTPRWGAITASCADAGTWALINEIQLEFGPTQRTEQIDEAVSVRHSWLGSNLLSFDDESEIEILKADVPLGKGRHRLVEGFSLAEDYGDLSQIRWWLSIDEYQEPALEATDPWFESPDPRSSVIESDRIDITRRSQVGPPDFVTAFPGLLVAARDGRLRATRISTWSGYPDPFGDIENVAEVNGRVLAVADTDGGFIIETDSELHYIPAGDPVVLIARETISLRGYPRSRRHRRAITATVDGGLLITALLGTHLLPHDERRVISYPH